MYTFNLGKFSRWRLFVYSLLDIIWCFLLGFYFGRGFVDITPKWLDRKLQATGMHPHPNCGRAKAATNDRQIQNQIGIV